jgi:pimeloyl-ACP methyl ester carboxylesterase
MFHVLFAPGLNCTEELFAPQIAALPADAAFGIVDHRLDLSLEEIVDRALAGAPDRFALVGLSMGGYIAAEFMRRAAGRITRLALLDTRAVPDTPEDRERRRETIRLAESGRFDAIHTLLWPRLVHPDRLGDEALEATVRRMHDSTGPAAFVRQQQALLGRRDYRDVLRAVRVPTLIMVGDSDMITPPAASRELAALIPGSRLVEIPQCGHLSTLERPDVVNAELKRWLET